MNGVINQCERKFEILTAEGLVFYGSINNTFDQ